LLEEVRDRIDERLSDPIEYGIHKPFGFLPTLFIGCPIKAPAIKIIHSGVLAMRVVSFAKQFSQRTSLFQTPILLTTNP
jgi:hypothetical protein